MKIMKCPCNQCICVPICKKFSILELQGRCSLIKQYFQPNENRVFRAFDISVTLVNILSPLELRDFHIQMIESEKLYSKVEKVHFSLNPDWWNVEDILHIKKWFLIKLPIFGWVWILLKNERGKGFSESFGFGLLFPLGDGVSGFTGFRRYVKVGERVVSMFNNWRK